MYMFQRRKEQSWIVNLKGASLLGIGCCGILSPKALGWNPSRLKVV